jgi:hypothetical protein
MKVEGKKVTTIEDIRNLLKGDYLKPMLHVRDETDPLYKNIRGIVMRVYPNTEDYMYNIQGKFTRMLESMNMMEPNDYNKIVNTFKKYEVKGMNRGITGQGTYGYDISRTDRKLIRRRR